MSIHNTYKGWRTSIIGVVFLAVGVAYLAYSLKNTIPPDYIILSILLSSGILLIFSPDFLIIKLQNLIDKKSKEL